jgi:hypothetical protein
VLWNHNYLSRFQFRFRIWTIKSTVSKNFWEKVLPFYVPSFIVKCEWKNFLLKEIKFTILYFVFVRTFVIPFYYGAETVINPGSGSDFLTSYSSGSGYTRQKVALPMVSVPFPQHFLIPIFPKSLHFA